MKKRILIPSILAAIVLLAWVVFGRVWDEALLQGVRIGRGAC